MKTKAADANKEIAYIADQEHEVMSIFPAILYTKVAKI